MTVKVMQSMHMTANCQRHSR